jgi:hypothetical protein
MEIVLWSNNVALPVAWKKSRQLVISTPSISKGVLLANTVIGYQEQDFCNHYDGLHTRTLSFVVLGFGLTLKVKWDDDGRFK